MRNGYTTDELKKLEEIILGAEDKLFILEYDLFCEVRSTISAEVCENPEDSHGCIAWLDVLASLSVVAIQKPVCAPEDQ